MSKTMPQTNLTQSAKEDRPRFLLRVNFVPDKKTTLIGLAVIMCAAALLVYNSLYGISTPDEAFYPLVPFRYLRGARPFIDEWHAEQLSGFLQYPLVWLFVKITGCAEGIILYFRMLFIFVQLLFSGAVFLCMKRFGFANALTAALLFELYVTEYTLSLDYYTLSLFAVFAVGLLILFSKNLTPVKWVLCGVLLACAVLAEPPFVIVYVLWGSAVIIAAIFRKRPHPALAFKSFCFVTVGTALAAAVFFAFLFTKETPSEFISNFFNVFRSGEYMPNAFGVGFIGFAQAILRDFSWAAVVAVIFIAVILLDGNRIRRRPLWAFVGTTVFAVLVLMTAVSAVKNKYLLPFVNLPFAVAFMGVCAYILSEKKDKKLLALWLVGPLYTAVIAVTSESMIYAGATGFSVSSVAAVPMVYYFCKELKQDHEIKSKRRKPVFRRKNGVDSYGFRVVPVAAAILFASVLCVYSGMLLSRDPVAEVFQRGPLKETVLIEYGAFKGIRISPEQKKVMDDVLSDVAFIEEQTDEKYTVLSDNFWYLFSSDREPLAFTLWYEDRIIQSGAYEDFYDYIGEIPSYFYIVNKAFYWYPAGTEKKEEVALAHVTENYPCTVTEGKAGYIIKVDNTKAS